MVTNEQIIETIKTKLEEKNEVITEQQEMIQELESKVTELEQTITSLQEAEAQRTGLLEEIAALD